MTTDGRDSLRDESLSGYKYAVLHLVADGQQTTLRDPSGAAYVFVDVPAASRLAGEIGRLQAAKRLRPAFQRVHVDLLKLGGHDRLVAVYGDHVFVSDLRSSTDPRLFQTYRIRERKKRRWRKKGRTTRRS